MVGMMSPSPSIRLRISSKFLHGVKQKPNHIFIKFIGTLIFVVIVDLSHPWGYLVEGYGGFSNWWRKGGSVQKPRSLNKWVSHRAQWLSVLNSWHHQWQTFMMMTMHQWVTDLDVKLVKRHCSAAWACLHFGACLTQGSGMRGSHTRVPEPNSSPPPWVLPRPAGFLANNMQGSGIWEKSKARLKGQRRRPQGNGVCRKMLDTCPSVGQQFPPTLAYSCIAVQFVLCASGEGGFLQAAWHS